MHIDLLLDMAAIERDTSERFISPALERLVARGDVWPCAAISFEACLLDRFGVSTNDPPIAALTVRGDGMDPEQQYWLRADPVSLQATRTRLLLAPLPHDDLSDDEAQALAASLRSHLAASGYELFVCHPQRWYIRCASTQQLHTEAPLTTAGLLTEDRMPSGEDGPSWRRLMTEAQMLLHQHPVNDARAASGRLPVTGIWPWGGGVMAAIPRSRYTDVYSDDVLALGLGSAGGATPHPLPRDMDEVLAHRGAHSDVLIASTTLPRGVDATRFDAAWILPLSAALTRGVLSEIRLMLVSEAGVVSRTVQRSHLRRFWRRSRPLSSHA